MHRQQGGCVAPTARTGGKPPPRHFHRFQSTIFHYSILSNHPTTDELELAPYPQGPHEAPGGCGKAIEIVEPMLELKQVHVQVYAPWTAVRQFCGACNNRQPQWWP